MCMQILLMWSFLILLFIINKVMCLTNLREKSWYIKVIEYMNKVLLFQNVAGKCMNCVWTFFFNQHLKLEIATITHNTQNTIFNHFNAPLDYELLVQRVWTCCKSNRTSKASSKQKPKKQKVAFFPFSSYLILFCPVDKNIASSKSEIKDFKFSLRELVINLLHLVYAYWLSFL